MKQFEEQREEQSVVTVEEKEDVVEAGKRTLTAIMVLSHMDIYV